MHFHLNLCSSHFLLLCSAVLSLWKIVCSRMTSFLQLDGVSSFHGLFTCGLLYRYLLSCVDVSVTH